MTFSLNLSVSLIKLLSPCGDWDCLKAAASEGADAVYFGLGSFNARQRATNFRQEELTRVVGYCHDRGIECHLTANTLVKNHELQGWASMVSNAYSAGVDAIILQEISFLPLLKECFPDLKVHISTQAGIFNTFQSKLLSGADMVVMPREMPLNQIREFHQNTKLPTEVFVQGALCFSISGQCLMSSFLGGRSGNRGLCAQPCRKRYNGRYALSSRDLSLIEKLPLIADAKVACIKIEGRLRGPNYVGAATALYRRGLDSLQNGQFQIDTDAQLDMELSFSRDYTLGGAFKEYDITTPLDCGKRGVFLGILGEGGTIKPNVGLRIGDGVGIVTPNGEHGDILRRMFASGRQIDRTMPGQTVCLDINATKGDQIFLTSGSARRRIQNPPQRTPIKVKRGLSKLEFPFVLSRKLEQPRLLVRAYTLKDAFAALDAGAQRAYYDIFANDFPHTDLRISPYVPRNLPNWAADKIARTISSMPSDSVLCGDLGVATQLRGTEVFLDINSNAFNDIDVSFYNDRGLIPVVSPELTLTELRDFKDKRFAVYAHGRIPLMSTKYSLREDILKDELGYEFPVRAEYGQKQILNSVPFGLFSEVSKLLESGMVCMLLDLEKDVAQTVSAYRRILSGEKIRKPDGYTLGHFKQKVA
jgi:collagenase-like PrtC family protease